VDAERRKATKCRKVGDVMAPCVPSGERETTQSQRGGARPLTHN